MPSTLCAFGLRRVFVCGVTRYIRTATMDSPAFLQCLARLFCRCSCPLARLSPRCARRLRRCTSTSTPTRSMFSSSWKCTMHAARGHRHRHTHAHAHAHAHTRMPIGIHFLTQSLQCTSFRYTTNPHPPAHTTPTYPHARTLARTPIHVLELLDMR